MGIQTIEILENDFWGDCSDAPTRLTKTICTIRKKNLIKLTVEDLRITIGQDLSLKILIPIAIDYLRKDLFINGDYYPGDLLQVVLDSKPEYWQENVYLKNELIEICNDRIQEISALVAHDVIVEHITSAYKKFIEG